MLHPAESAPTSADGGIARGKFQTAVQRIQAVYRGHSARKQFKSFVASLSQLDTQAVIRCIMVVETWHRGWSTFLYSLIVLIFLITLLYFQFIYSTPGNLDFNNQILNFVNSASSAYSSVNQPSDVLAYVGALLTSLQSLAVTQAPNSTAVCDDFFLKYCNGYILVNDSRTQECIQVNAETGYIDAQNQLLYAIFLLQNRRRAVKCDTLEPYSTLNLSGSAWPQRACLKTDLDFVYESDFCTESPSLCNSTLFQGFTYSPLIPGFALPFHGASMNIPPEATQCLVNTYVEKQYLDYRTSDATVVAFFFNRNGQGRIGILQDEFDFSVGGAVSTVRFVGSVSVLGSSTTVLALNVVFTILWAYQVLHDVLLIKTRRLDVLSVQFLFFLGADFMGGAVTVVCYLYYNELNKFTPPQVYSSLISTPRGFLTSALQMRTLTNQLAVFSVIAAFALLLFLVRLLILLNFHASLAIVTGTLTIAASSLFYFACVFVLCWLCYAATGMILLGPTQPVYKDLASALNELLFIAVQDWSVSRAIIFPGLGTPYQQVFQAIFLWSWIVLALVLMFNIVVGILVNGFQQLQEGDEDSHDAFLSAPQSLLLHLRFLFSSFKVTLRSLCSSICGRGQKNTDLESRFDRLVRFRESLQQGRSRAYPAVKLRAEIGKDIITGRSYEAMLGEIRRRTRKSRFTQVTMRLLAIGEPNSAEVQGEVVDLLMKLHRMNKLTGTTGPGMGMGKSPQA